MTILKEDLQKARFTSNFQTGSDLDLKETISSKIEGLSAVNWTKVARARGAKERRKKI